VKRLATDGLSLPIKVTLDFEHEGKRYQLVKSFLRSPSAQLFCDGIEMARAMREADEAVWDLLGIKPDNKIDQAAYGMLWVEQGQSFEVPKPSEGAASVLNDVIQQEVGTLVGGERARLFLNSVKEDLARYLTDGGRPRAKGPLEAAASETARLTSERLDAEARLATLNGKIDELARLRADYRAASDPETMKTLRDELKDAQSRLAEAEKSDAELTRLASDERQAHERAEAQRERLDALKARATAIDEQRLRLKELAAKLAPLNEQEQAATKALQAAAAQKSSLDREAETLDSRESELQRLAALGVKLEHRGKLSQRLTLLEDFSRRAAANDAALKAASVDEAALKALDAIENEERQIRAGMEAGAARVAIEARPGADVAVNGTAISGNAMRSVTEPLDHCRGHRRGDHDLAAAGNPRCRHEAAGGAAREASLTAVAPWRQVRSGTPPASHRTPPPRGGGTRSPCRAYGSVAEGESRHRNRGAAGCHRRDRRRGAARPARGKRSATAARRDGETERADHRKPQCDSRHARSFGSANQRASECAHEPCRNAWNAGRGDRGHPCAARCGSCPSSRRQARSSDRRMRKRTRHAADCASHHGRRTR
jgi:hypothetical protein